MFDIKGNKVVLSADYLATPPFKDYFNRAEDKQKALKEIEFIVWRYKWDTPYNAYPEKERTKRVAVDIFGDSNYTPSEELKQLAIRFNEFQETPSTRLLQAS